MHKEFTNEALEMIAERFRILSEPIRLRLMILLRNGEMTVTELTMELNTSQPNVSKHLKLLTDADILKRDQRGNSVFYSIADESIFELCDLVCDSLGQKYKKRADIFALV